MTIKNTQIEIAEILRNIGSESCLEKAKELEDGSSSSSLHLRALGLSSADVCSISSCFNRDGDDKKDLLTSVSFSYNNLMGDAGAIALTRYLPRSITELGLVNCGIGDVGGIALLEWIKEFPNLSMICVEGNDFSENLRSEFRVFSKLNPQVMVVV